MSYLLLRLHLRRLPRLPHLRPNNRAYRAELQLEAFHLPAQVQAIARLQVAAVAAAVLEAHPRIPAQAQAGPLHHHQLDHLPAQAPAAQTMEKETRLLKLQAHHQLRQLERLRPP